MSRLGLRALAESFFSSQIMAVEIFAVLPTPGFFQPCRIRLIPPARVGKAAVEIPLWFPAKFALQFRSIERIAAVMRRAVGHKAQQVFGTAERSQDSPRDGYVFHPAFA